MEEVDSSPNSSKPSNKLSNNKISAVAKFSDLLILSFNILKIKSDTILRILDWIS